MPIKVIHAADFHLDSAFASLDAEQARLRRRESRLLVEQLAEYANREQADLVLLAGDLFDGDEVYRETLERLPEALGSMRAKVFIAPGNHDFYSARSPYATLRWPENVHIFHTDEMVCVALPELSCVVYGAAFTAPVRETSPLTGFRVQEDGMVHLGVLHADRNAAKKRYAPITDEEIAASGLDYLALGHVHECSGVKRAGETFYAYSGCLEGRGFDEQGERGFLSGTVEKGRAKLEFIPFAGRRYETITLDVTGKSADEALCCALPKDTARDLYRVVFTGETGDHGIALQALLDRFGPQFFRLELCDRTHVDGDVWARMDEDSLRGAFLRCLRAKYTGADEAERSRIEQAVRFGLAALDHCDR